VPRERRMEGPFGDHYDATPCAPFPVFNVDRIITERMRSFLQQL
jgi:UbiD family decarboxylase